MTTPREKFAEIHWGDDPEVSVRLYVPVGTGVPIGTAKAITYASKKRGRAEVFRHVFETPPLLLSVNDAKGGRPLKALKGTPVVLGQLISIALVGQRERVRGVGALVVTDVDGSGVWLAGLSGGVPLAFEQSRRGGRLKVLEGGIEG